MPADQDVASFIGSSFKSVWAIELLLHLKRHPERDWSKEDLLKALRASELVVSSNLDWLTRAGLIVRNEDGSARYAPAAPDLEQMADATELLYAKKPDAVRRMIIAAATDGLTAFADAFRLRRE
jgi:hypothetical protein